MNDALLLVLILLLVAGVPAVLVWSELRADKHAGTIPDRVPPNARPSRRVADKDADLLAKLNEIEWP